MNCGAGDVGLPALNATVSKHARCKASGYSSAITASLNRTGEALQVSYVVAFHPPGLYLDRLDCALARGTY